MPKISARRKLDDTRNPIEEKPGAGVKQATQKYAEYLEVFAQFVEVQDSKRPVVRLGTLNRAGSPIPVYAVHCDPENVEAYAAAISKLDGLVIAVDGDAMQIPSLAWCYAHKPARKVGNKGMADYLRAVGGEDFIECANSALDQAGTGNLMPSEVVAVELDDTNRGGLKGNAVLFVNGPKVPKGKKTTYKQASALRKAFDNAVKKANEIGCRKVGFTGISTGEFNFDNPRGGAIAMESMIDALAAGKLDQAVGLFWRRKGLFEGSTAEGAMATLFAHPNFEVLVE